MSVPERDLTSASSGKLAQVDLPRLLVTIDDLRALFELMENLSDSKVVAEFDGGEFDDPDDMRSLPDESLARIRVRATSVQVLLGDTKAYVTGSPRNCEHIRKIWAEPRRRRIWPKSRRAIGRRQLFRTSLIFSPLAMLFLIPALTAPGDFHFKQALLLSLVLGTVLLMHLIAYFGPMSFSCATVIPATWEEFRKDQEERARHRRTIFVTIVGFVIAAVVAFVTKGLKA
ncbi:hypothetical protein [Saccharopolyspora sp. NPDC002578]